MPPVWTPEKIAAMTDEQRVSLYSNCVERADNPQAISIIDMIMASGLPFRKKGHIAQGDPEVREIELIVNNPENEARMLDAVAKGAPPLAVIEPLIVASLGNRYNAETGGTVEAGFLIAQRLYALGYEKRPAKPMPPGSVAKTAATYRKTPGAR